MIQEHVPNDGHQLRYDNGEHLQRPACIYSSPPVKYGTANLSQDAFSIYHKIQEESEPLTPTPSSPALPAIGHALAGSIGTAISNITVYPLDLIITRLQVQRLVRGKQESADPDLDEYRNVADAAYKIYSQEGGISAFYTGAAQDTAKSIVDAFLFFLAYNFMRQHRLRGRTTDRGKIAKTLPLLDELGVGMLAGAFSKFFTTPISNIVTRKQITSMVVSRTRSGDKTALKPAKPTVASIATDIYTNKGLAGFWSGYSATLILTLNPSLTFLFHNTLRRALLLGSKPGAHATFLLAAISKALASVIMYPFSLAKARSQAGGEHKRESSVLTTRTKTVFGTLLAIARIQGISALYEGATGEVVKGFLANGMTMMLKEIIHRSIVRLYHMISILPRRHLLSEIIGQTREQVFSAGGYLRGTVAKAGEQARDALMDLGDEVEEVAAAMGEDANDVFWGMVDGTTGTLEKDVADLIGGGGRRKGDEK
ncbi:hypothetical protein GP486_005614 [Trichoglossum hirsutum]|uniref:Mitochondrial carrier protein n=1 Tax=Trichoglossum hirsutum TaxID=265104 RepID=A0A9P8RLY3_9PEZI|nr:hypothetical protein GP486_005614 [Trichoglossum hirsutum]